MAIILFKDGETFKHLSISIFVRQEALFKNLVKISQTVSEEKTFKDYMLIKHVYSHRARVYTLQGKKFDCSLKVLLL